MSNWVLKNIWRVGFFAAIPLILIGVSLLIDLPKLFVLVSAVSLWLYCLVIAGGASRHDSLALEERQELQEARIHLAQFESKASASDREIFLASASAERDTANLRQEIAQLKDQIGNHHKMLTAQVIPLRRMRALVPEVEILLKEVIIQVESRYANTSSQIGEVYIKAREQVAFSEEISAKFLGTNIYDAGVRDLSALSGVLTEIFQILNQFSETLESHRGTIADLAMLMRRLVSDTAAVNKFSDALRDISDHANLLKLNTEITVARSGIGVKGVDGVAEGVRRISDGINLISHEFTRVFEPVPDSLARISKAVEEALNTSTARIEAVSASVQRLVGAAKLSSSVLAKMMSGSISRAETITLNIDNIASSFTSLDQFRLAIDAVISPIRQIEYYADELLSDLTPLLGAEEAEAVDEVPEIAALAGESALDQHHQNNILVGHGESAVS